MKIVIGSDHAGFSTKETIKSLLRETSEKPEILDCGSYTEESCDYPDFAHKVALEVSSGKADFGILACTTANGVAMAANKHLKVRAAICWLQELAFLARSHNDANLLCIPSRFVVDGELKKIVKSFLETPFEGGRHQRRRDKIDVLDATP